MYRNLICTTSIALAAGAIAAPAAALQAPAEVLPKDRNALLRGDTPHSAEPRGVESPATGEFFSQPRPLAVSATPDSEVRGPVESIAIDRERLYFQPGADSTWVRGKTYKAEAAKDGFTYIPFLGSEAPRNYPVSFRLTSATLGGREIELADRASVTRSGDRIVLDRGAVDVIYDFAVESVEQSFALDVAGATSDLALEMEVTTELGAAPEGAAFTFANELGGMRYGEAIVLDGTGRSAHVPAELSGTSLTLTVPADFLAAAAGTVVVDPLLSTFSVDTASGYQRDVEIAYQAETDRFFYVYEDQFSGTDVDIYATDITSGGASPRGDYMDFGSENWTDPSAATVNTATKGLVAARNAGTSGNSIVARTWNFGSGSFDAGILQVTTPSTTVVQTQPDVGGSWAATADARFVIVWNADFGPDSDAQGRIVMPDGTFGSSLFLDSSTGFDSTDICISESTGDPTDVNRWNVAWINRRLADEQYTVEVTQLNANGSVAFPHFPVVTLPVGDSVGELDVSDAIAFPGTSVPTYTIAYDQFSTIEEDTFITFVQGGNPINTVELQRSEHADLTLDQAEARLSSNAEEFIVSYLEQSPGIGTYNGFITAFDFTEGQFLSISERRVSPGAVGADSIPAGYTDRGGLALASRYSGGLSTSRYVGVGYDTGIGVDANVTGHVYFPSNGYSPAFQYCYGNPNSTGDRGFIRLSGSRSTTSNKQMIATALPTFSFGYFVVGTDFANSMNPGGSAGVLCVGGTVGRYSNAVASSGSSGSITVPFDPQQISQPDGPVPAISGSFWQFALWHRDTVSGTATSNFTNSVSILFE